MHTFTTDLTAQQVQQLINEIVVALGLSSFPLNDHSYQQRENMTVLAEIAPDKRRNGAMHAWIVGYQDVNRTTAQVLVFPHEWATFDIGSQAIYDAFVRRIGERLTPAQPDQPVEAPESKTTATRQPTENDRIRTTLMTWARRSEKYRSYADAATQLGTIDVDTRRNHEVGGWLYSDEEMEARGGYEYLWQLYTTEYRKS